MNKIAFLTFAAAAALLACAAPARAALSVDTGTPNGNAAGAYAFDSNDAYAAQITFTSESRIQTIATHVLGGVAGEVFTVALYGDSGAYAPGTMLYSASATFSADGWNGVSGLSDWNVQAGNYWVGLEVNAGDTLGSTSVTGALLDRGVSSPMPLTAFNSGSGYKSSVSTFDFGLQVTAVPAVPEPSEVALLLLGLAAFAPVAARRRRTQESE